MYVYRRAEVGDSPLTHDEHVVESGVDYLYIDIYVCIYTYNIDICIYMYRRAKVGDSPLAHD